MSDYANPPRRKILQAATLAVIAGPVVAAEECIDIGVHPNTANSDDDLDKVVNHLWSMFAAGVDSLGGSPEVGETVQKQIIAETRRVLRRKVKFFEICQRETEMCCYSAGVIAETQRRAKSTTGKQAEIDIKLFRAAKRAVQLMQGQRVGKNVAGIAC